MKETDKQNQHQGNYTYIVKCSDGTLYTGWTNNLKKRLEAHNSGKERCQVYEEPPPGGAGVFWGVWHEAGSDEKGVCD